MRHVKIRSNILAKTCGAHQRQSCTNSDEKIFSEFRNSTELNTSDADTQYDDCVIGSDEVFNCLQKVEWGFSQQLLAMYKMPIML